MFNTDKEAKNHLKKWFKENGWDGEVVFSASYGLVTYKGRLAWEFDLIKPCGVFFVFNDTGDVEDNYGVVAKSQKHPFRRL